MSCSNPLYAYAHKMDDGKYSVKLIGPKEALRHPNFSALRAFYGDEFMLLPCGSCDECIQAHKSEWALRCELESKYHKENCYITLTYDDKHVGNNILTKHDLQEFIRKLRDFVGHDKPFKYFGCGEYGDKFGRKHYHLCLFGYWPEDAKLWSHRDRLPIFKSQILDVIWSKGIVEFSTFSGATAKYVAGYCSKKYGYRDGFILMSLKPAIGYAWCIDNLDRLKRDGFIMIKNGDRRPIPRYYRKIMEREGIDTSQLMDLKAESRHLLDQYEMNQRSCLHWEEMIKRRHQVMKDKIKRRKRM